MDSVERAVGLSDSKLADAVNKNWLISSGQSSQLSSSFQRHQLNLSSSSSLGWPTTGVYGATGREFHEHDKTRPADTYANPNWSLRHYINLKQNNFCKQGRFDRNSLNSSNSHLYDNISFSDSPLLTRSLNHKERQEGEARKPDEAAEFRGQYEGFCFGHFRIFLACYLLLGITLAIYSRNALSLAAVGMVANNEINKELVELLAHSSAPMNTSSRAGIIQDALDGSCPVTRRTRSANKESSSSQAFYIMLNYLPPELNYTQASKTQLESAFRASVKQRIERGELVDWSPGEQGFIFAAGSLGNLLIAVPLTRLGEIYGPKWIIFVASLGATIQAALMPLVSTAHVSLVILFQVIFNGLTYGADCVAYTLFAHWLTPTEMAFFVSCLLICYQMGNIISSFITAKILTDGVAWSWCFYTPAILCGIWTVLWAIIGSSEPSKSIFVSKQELNHLQKHSKLSQQSRELSPHDIQTSESQVKRISWLKLARDPNIWAIIAVKFTLRWHFSVYTSLMPTFLSSVAHMSVDTIGKVSVFQSVVGLVSGILMGYLTRSIVIRRPLNLSLANFRKIFQSIVNFGLSITLLVFILFDCNKWVTIISLTLGGICITFYVAAALQLPLDLSPDHCGLITSISNTLAIGQAIGAPISGLILNDGPRDRDLWRKVWALIILLNTFSGILFIFLVDSKPRLYDSVTIDDNRGEKASGSNENRENRRLIDRR